jgi:hypothetical protein
VRKTSRFSMPDDIFDTKDDDEMILIEEANKA